MGASASSPGGQSFKRYINMMAIDTFISPFPNSKNTGGYGYELLSFRIAIMSQLVSYPSPSVPVS